MYNESYLVANLLTNYIDIICIYRSSPQGQEAARVWCTQAAAALAKQDSLHGYQKQQAGRSHGGTAEEARGCKYIFL